jgi:Cupredoxin-like domain
LEISVSNSISAIVVPERAVQLSEEKRFVWVAHPSAGNEFTVSQHEVTIGATSSGMTEIKSGIDVNDQVVLDPPIGLSVDTRVVNIEDPKPISPDQVVEITAAGYSPPSISIPANKAFRVTFIRRDDKSCGTEVIFPSLGIRRPLPLNKPVVIDIPPQSMGKQLAFTCPMNMLNGKAVAK